MQILSMTIDTVHYYSVTYEPLAIHIISGAHVFTNYIIPSIWYSVPTSLSVSSQNKYKSPTHYIGTRVHEFSINLETAHKF
jgi:hypothetical protein